MSNKKHGILFLSYYFPPMRTIAIWRNYFIASEAKLLFDNLFIFTSSNKNLFEQEYIDISSFDVTLLKTYDYRRILSSGKSSNISFKENKKQNPYSRFGIKLLNSFPFSFLIGEGGIFYIYDGFRKAEKLVNENKISHLYSSYRPMADHWIAFFLKRKYTNLHWTADFRDLPLDDVYKNYLGRRLQKQVLRILLKKADLVTTFANGLQKGMQEYSDKQVQIIPNGLFRMPVQNENLALQNKFTLQYTGSLFLNERDPSILFKAVAELIYDEVIDQDNFIIQYAGKDGNQWQQSIEHFGLSSVSLISAEISAEEARALQQKAHINILLTTAQPGFTGIFTGKFFEYLASGRPMLVIINGIRDEEFEAVFTKYHLGKLVYTKKESITNLKAFIAESYLQWKQTGQYNWEVDTKIGEDFSWRKSIEVWRKLMIQGEVPLFKSSEE